MDNTPMLKPCPFCGCEQITTSPDHEFGDVTWDAVCKACGTRVRRDLEADAITAWNTRNPFLIVWLLALLSIAKIFVGE